LNPRPEAVVDAEFRASEFFDARDMAQVKYEMVRRVRVGGQPVARAAASFGLSRPSFYQARAALDQAGLAGLVPAKPGPKAGRKLTAEMVAFAEAARARDPGAGAAGLADMVFERFGVRVHPRTVGRALAKASKSPGRR
jgi:transposase